MLTSLLLITLYAITLHIVKSDLPTTSRPSLTRTVTPIVNNEQLIDSINTYCDTAIEWLATEPRKGRKTNAWHAEQMDNTLTLTAGTIDTLKAMLEALPVK